DGDRVRRRRGVDAGRVRARPEPAGRLLRKAGAAEHRGCGDPRVPAIGGDLGRTLPARGLPRDLETETEAVPARLTVTKRSAPVLVDQWAPRWHLTGQGMCPP